MYASQKQLGGTSLSSSYSYTIREEMVKTKEKRGWSSPMRRYITSRQWPVGWQPSAPSSPGHCEALDSNFASESCFFAQLRHRYLHSSLRCHLLPPLDICLPWHLQQPTTTTPLHTMAQNNEDTAFAISAVPLSNLLSLGSVFAVAAYVFSIYAHNPTLI